MNNSNTQNKFDPTKHLTKIQGRDYLEVKWRLVWFRQDHPDYTIETLPVEINSEKMYAIFRAMVKDETGRMLASATKVETRNGFADYLEKAETGAVGRALALVGYGTQFAPELNEAHRIVDAPVKQKANSKGQDKPAAEAKKADIEANPAWQGEPVTVRQVEKLQQLAGSHFSNQLAEKFALDNPMQLSKGQASRWISELSSTPVEARKPVVV